MSGGWGLSLRLAWREARRRPGRTALVMTVIGLPVAALAVGLIVVRTGYQSPAEGRAAALGQADRAFSPNYSGPLARDPRGAVEAVAAAAPDGSRAVAVTTAGDAATRSDGHLERVGLSDQPLDDPLFEGRLTLSSGRVPRGSDEIAAGDELLERLDVGVGDDVDLLALGTVTITGTVRETSAGDFRVGAVLGAPLSPSVHQVANGAAWRVVFLDLPPGVTGPVAPLPDFIEFGAADGYTDPQHARRLLGIAYAAGAVGLVLAGTVAAAAFAVSARRHLRLLGVLSATGVPPRGLRRVMVLQGVVTGALASTAGLGVALAVALAIEPHLDRWMSRAVTPLDIPVPYLGLAWIMGVTAAAFAAWVPARTAARVPVLAALAGRRPQPPARVLGPVAGVGLGALGAATIALFVSRPEPPWGLGLAGAVLVLGGGILCTPWLVSRFEPVAGRVHGSARLAARGLARNRVRTCAVATAIMAPAVAATFGATIAASQHEAWRDHQLRDDQVVVQASVATEAEYAAVTSLVPDDDALDEVRDIVPGASEGALRLVAKPESEPGYRVAYVRWSVPNRDTDSVEEPSSTIAIASDDLLDALAAPPGTADLLDENTVVALHPVPDDFVARLESPVGVEQPVLFDRAQVVVAAVSDSYPFELPSFVVSQGWADARGLGSFDSGVLLRASAPFTGAQRHALLSSSAENPDDYLRWEVLGTPPPSSGRWDARIASADGDERALPAAIAAGVLVFTLLVVAATLALNSAETRDERSVLLAIGVPPRVERASRAWEAALLPLVAMVIAVPLGLACAFAVLAARVDDGHVLVDPAVPWLVVTALLVGVPVVSGVLTRLVVAVTGRLGRPANLAGTLAWD